MKIGTRSSRPIPIEIGGKPYLLPVWKRDDWKNFSAKLEADRIEEATKHLKSDVEKAKARAYFPLAPLTYNDLRQRAGTVDGIHEVVTQSLKAAKVDDDTIKTILHDTPMNDIEALAFMLAGFMEVPDTEVQPPPDFTDGQKPDSNPSAETKNET